MSSSRCRYQSYTYAYLLSFTLHIIVKGEMCDIKKMTAAKIFVAVINCNDLIKH